MKTLWAFLLLLCLAGTAHSQTVEQYAPEILGGINYGSLGFSRGHWIPSIGKMVTFLQPQFTTSIRAFDPITNSWSYEWPENSLGIEGRDNYASFYIPKLDQLWIWEGSHLEECKPGGNCGSTGGPRWAGRYSFTTHTWLDTSTPVRQAGAPFFDAFVPTRSDDAFEGVLDFSAVGHVVAAFHTDPAVAWAVNSDMGLLIGGTGDDDNTFVIEAKPGGPEPYKITLLQAPSTPRPPIRSQCQNCMASDGTNFWVSGGLYQEPGNSAHLQRKDLWKFTASTKTWSEKSPPPDMGEAPAVTFDLSLNAVVLNTKGHIYVYDVANDQWSDKTPPGFPCIKNQIGVYIPAPTNAHFYEGGNDCVSDASPFQNLKVTLTTNGLNIPNRTWVYRPFHTVNAPGQGPEGTGGGSKHLRFAQNGLTGRIHELGGDWSTTSAFNSQITQWNFDIVNDTWAIEKDPVCGAQGEHIPGGPDEVGWIWDSNRSIFWMLPGFLFIDQGQVRTCNTEKIPWTVDSPGVFGGHWAVSVAKHKPLGNFYTEGVHFSVAATPANSITVTNISIPAGTVVELGLAPNGSAQQHLDVMTYNPATHQWTVVPGTNEERGGRFAIFDAAADRIRRVSPGNDLVFTEYDPETNQRSAVFKTCAEAYPGTADTTGPCAGGGVYVGSLQPQEEYYAWDPQDRRIYLIDPHTYKAFWYGVDDHRLVQIAPMPEPNPGRIALTRSGQFGMGDFTMPVFDTVNHVLLYPYVDALNYCGPVGTPDASVCVDKDGVPQPNDTNRLFGSAPQLLIYHPSTDANPALRDTWEPPDPMFQPEGRKVRGNSFFFDHMHNALVAIGGLNATSDLDGTVTGYFLWRYGSAGAPTQATATVTSTPTGASVAVNTADIFGATNGVTNFSRKYLIADAKTVSFTAAATHDGNNFSDWNGPCASRSTVTVTLDTCTVLVTSDKNLRPVYSVGPSVPRELRINSTNPAAGVPITLSPADLGNQSTCTTPCILSYNDTQPVTATAELNYELSGPACFTTWSGGVNSFAGNVATINMTANKVASAGYVASGPTYKNSAQFSIAQGACGWSYYSLSGSTFAPMTFTNGRWGEASDALLIMPGGVSHPGTTRSSVLQWTAPAKQSLRISGSVSDADPGGGDGVDVSITKDGVALFAGTLENGNTQGLTYNFVTAAIPGSVYRFIVSPRGNNFNDTTLFDPLIAPELEAPHQTTLKFGNTEMHFGPNVVFGE